MATGQLAGKVCLVTGAGAGIGQAAVAELARRGATVVAMVRDEPRGRKMLEDLRRQTGNEQLELLVCDLASQRSVREAVERFKAKHRKLHLLVHQAGLAPERHQLTADGVELAMAVNHFSPFLLTQLLRETLVASAPARVVVGVGGISAMGKINFEDIHSKKSWKQFRVLAQSKLANVLFTVELARQLQGSGVTVNLFDPMAAKTNFAKGSWSVMGVMMALARLTAPTADKVAVDLVDLATAPEFEGVTGRYFTRRSQGEVPKSGRDPELAKRFWALSEELTAGTPVTSQRVAS